MGGVVALDNHVPPLPDQMVERSISDTPLEELTTPRSKSPGDACEKSPNARLERRSRQRDSDVSTADTTGSSRPSISSVPDIAEVQSLLSEVEDDTTPCSNLSQCSQEMMSTSRCPSDGAWTFDEACEKSPNARLEVRSRLSGQSGVSTADTTGADMPSARSEVEDDTTPCSNLSQCSQEMMSTHTFAPSSLAPGANACQCSQVEWQLWWQSLAYEGACQKNLEQQQWLQQVEAQNNELTVLVAALRAEKRVLEQRLFRCDDELFEAKECLMAEFIQHRALQKELEREREICSGARCRNEKLQSMYEDACQQRDQETMQVELCRQQLQRVETRNDELTALVSALEAAKERLEQRSEEKVADLGELCVTAAGSPAGEMPLWQRFQSSWHSQEGSGASSPSQSTCDSDVSWKEELPESAPHSEPAREEDLPGALRADMGEVREGASSPVEMSVKACIPTFELPSLLQYLTVENILQWRLTSRQTASPRVLTHHLEEMGRLDRSESILEFSHLVNLALRHPDTFDALGREADAETVKYFECRVWCMRLASARWTHFADSDARRIVLANLRHLLGRCSDVSASVRKAAHHIVRNYGLGGLHWVRQVIAEAMLGRMENLLEESTEISEEASTQVMQCSAHLELILRALEEPQRQKWVSMLVRVLVGQKSCPKTLINDLKLLWRADDDPGRSYAEAERQLVALARDAGRGDMLNDLWDILDC